MNITIDLLAVIKVLFYIIWIALSIGLVYILASPMYDNLYTLGLELIIKVFIGLIILIVLALSVLVYGGIFWW